MRQDLSNKVCIGAFRCRLRTNTARKRGGGGSSTGDAEDGGKPPRKTRKLIDMAKVVCYRCGQKGHMKPDCPLANKPPKAF